MNCEVFVMTTSDFKGAPNEDGDLIVSAGKRREFRALKQAKKFAPGWLLEQKYTPAGTPEIVVRKDAYGQPLVVKIALEHQDIDEEELIQKRGLKVVKFKDVNGKQVPQSTPNSKIYGMVRTAGVWTLAEIKPETAVKRPSTVVPPPLPPVVPPAPPVNPEGEEEKPSDPQRKKLPHATASSALAV